MTWTRPPLETSTLPCRPVLAWTSPMRAWLVSLKTKVWLPVQAGVGTRTVGFTGPGPSHIPRRVKRMLQALGAPVDGAGSNSMPAGRLRTGPCRPSHSFTGKGAIHGAPRVNGEGQAGGVPGGFALGTSSIAHSYVVGLQITNTTPELTFREMALSRAACNSPATCCVAPWIWYPPMS